MKMTLILVLFGALVQSFAQKHYETDTVRTDSGNITITFIGHGTLMFEFNRMVIHVDPWSRLADYRVFPKADIILITHHHPDHLDSGAVEMISKKGTAVLLTQAAAEILKKGTMMKNGEAKTVNSIEVEAVPAYNTTKDRDTFHPKGRDNGYILTLGKKRFYIAGDTENIPEMASLKGIDVAFLPMNQPYTMTPEQLVDAVKKIHPTIIYPYHYGDSDLSTIRRDISRIPGVELRIRKMQ